MYRAIEDTMHSPDYGHYSAYGIVTPNGVMIRDVTTNQARLHTFLEKINRLNASELQIYELIEDFLLES